MPNPRRTATPQPGLETTFQHLSKTPNEAAVGVLVDALASPIETIQTGALGAILDRKSGTGQREVLKRLHTAPQNWRGRIESQKGRMTGALRDGLLSTDAQLCANACQVILWLEEYDLAPALLTALEDATNPQALLVAATLVSLADKLTEQLAAMPRHRRDRRDPQLIRQRFASSLEASVRRYNQHGRNEVVDAFLMLVDRDNVTLKQILQDPHHSTFVTLVGALLHNERPSIVQLLVSFLDDPHVPSAALSILSRRQDGLFLRALARKFSQAATHAALHNLKRIDSLACLKLDADLLDELEEYQQAGIVQLATHGPLQVSDAFAIVEHLLLHGKTAGRVAAVKALPQFSHAHVAALVIHALEDSEPRVQAAILPQIRKRGTPGAVARLIHLVDSPHECVRQAARESLAEFSFDRYLAAFDALDDDVRRTTGSLVRKIDPKAIRGLTAELQSRTRGRRLRGLQLAESMDAVASVESVVIVLLADDDHLVRGAAARALSVCKTPRALDALQRALSDRSQSVQEAAEQSLGHLGQSRP